jgi:hypothetical protein
MDPDNHMRLVNRECIPVRLADKGAVLRYPLPARFAHGRFHPVGASPTNHHDWC